MNRNSFTVLGAFLLVMMYNSSAPIGRSGQSSSSDHGESSNSSRATNSTSCSAMAGNCGDDFASEVASAVCGGEPAPCLDAAAEKPTSRIAIATLPDPVHTNLGLFFDRMTDAIQEAAQDEGYLYRSSILPWTNDSSSESGSLCARKEAEKCQRNKEAWPGALLFRNPGGSRLVVFVVGEFPTGGIHAAQFGNALQLIKNLAGGMPSELLILGPTFSGSLGSLSQLVTLHGASVTALSGTVSSFESMEEARKQRPAWLTFASFQQNDRYVIQQVLQFVSGLGFRPSDLTLLSEDETAYGRFSSITGAENIVRLYFPREISQLRSAYQSVLGAEQANARAPQITLPLDLQSAGTNEDTVRAYATKQLPLSQEAVLLGIVGELRAHHSRFVLLRATDPLDELFLARYLRTAYPQGRILTMGSDLLFPRELQDSRLHGILAVTPYPSLPRLAEEFKHERSNFVDRVFPSGFSIGTYNAFRALLQPHPSGPLWLPPGTELFNYGIPASVRAHVLGDVPFEVPPIFITTLGHNGFWPVDVLNPVVMPGSTLPVIAGREGFSTVSQHFPKEWGIFQAAAIAFALAFLAILMRTTVTAVDASVSQFARLRLDPRSGAIAILGIDALALLQLAAWPYFLSVFYPSGWKFGLLVFLELLSLAVIAVVSHDLRCRGENEKGKGRSRWVGIFGAASAVLLAGIPGTVLFGGYRAHQFVYRSIHITSGVSPVLPVVLLIASGIWWSWYTISGTALINERCTKLFAIPDAVSVVVQPQPIAKRAAAAAGVNVSGAASMQSVDSVPAPAAPASGLAPEGSADTTAASHEDVRNLTRLIRLSQEGNEEISHWMQPAIFDLQIHAPLALLMLACALIFGVKHALLSFEPWSFNLLVEVLLVISVATMIASALHLRGLWLHSRRLLIGLDSLPLRRGFKSVHWISCQSLWRLGGSGLHEYQRALSREFEGLQLAVNNGVLSLGGEMDRAVSKLRVQLKETRALDETALDRWTRQFRESRRRSDRELMASIEQMQQNLADAVLQALLYLQARWSGENVPLSEGKEAYEQLEKVYGHFWSQSVQAAEYFVCVHFINYILISTMRIRSLITAISGLYVITLLAFCSYPFEPALVIKSLMAVLLLFLAAVVATVYASMNRDATLSYITETQPGELGGGFWLQMVSFVGLPLLSLIAAQFPELSNALFSWIGPALQASR